jgi:endo-1,4-beta-xylanase
MQRRTFIKTSLGATFSAAAGFSLWADSSTLQAAGATRNVLVGSAVNNAGLHDPGLTAILAEQCRIVVPENDMKWSHVHPGPDRYDFARPDELMAFASQNSMLVRGHNLCWHAAQPDWLVTALNPQNAADLLTQHIRMVVGRYAGQIHSWDVVNEGVEPGDKRPDGLRKSNWLDMLGPSYIEIAYRTAAETDPKALLTYNEYGLEDDSAEAELRREATILLLRWMRKNRIPIHALGLQSHLALGSGNLPQWLGLHRILKEAAKLDLQVFVTELDIDDTGFQWSADDRKKLVADLCKDYLKNVLKHKNVTAVLTWGMVTHTDIDGEHRNRPLDEQLQPTPLFTAMLESLRKR